MKKNIIFALWVFVLIQVIGFIFGIIDELSGSLMDISKMGFMELLFPLLAILLVVKIKKISPSEINVWSFIFWCILFLSIPKIFELIYTYPMISEKVSLNTSIVADEKQSYTIGILFGQYMYFFTIYLISLLLGFVISKKILKK